MVWTAILPIADQSRSGGTTNEPTVPGAQLASYGEMAAEVTADRGHDPSGQPK